MAVHKIADYIMSRDAWKKKRDGAPYNVGKGAVSGVNIGDDIEAAYKSFSVKTAEKNVKDVDKLCKDLDTYSKKIKAKHPKFATDVVDKLLRAAKQHKATMENVVTAIKEIPQSAADAGYAYRQHIKDSTKYPIKGLAAKLLHLKGRLDCLGAIDDAWHTTAREGGSWTTKCENLKTPLTDKDKADLEAFFKKVG